MSTGVGSVVSHFPDAENGFTTSLSATIASGATTVGLNSVAGYTNGEPAVFVVDPSDATKKQTFTGIIDTSGVQVTSVVWTAGTNQSHSGGATVVDYATATHIAMMSKGIKVEHAQAGTHTNITQADANYIKDDAGNELLKWSKTASAVNEVTIKNAATATDPRISASGGDSNVNLNLRGKGLAKTVTIGAGAATIFPYDYVASGCVWSGDSYGGSLAASMTSGVVVINGNPITVAAVTARAFTTNVDTYIDVLDAGDGTGTVVYTTAVTNAASAALASNSIRIGIIQAAATITAATKVNQGQEDRVFPIASSIAYSVTDSLGNLICPRDPSRKLLGYRQVIATIASVSVNNTPTQILGLTCPVIIPAGRKADVIVYAPDISTNNTTTPIISTWDGVTNSGTKIQGYSVPTLNANTYTGAVNSVSPPQQPSITTATSKTYNAGIQNTTSATLSLNVATTSPAYIKIVLS